jgi:hypothetical protein
LRLAVLLAPVSGALMLTVGNWPCLLIAIPERIQDVQPYCGSPMIWVVTARGNEQGVSASWHCSECVRPGGRWCLRTGLNAKLRKESRGDGSTSQLNLQAFVGDPWPSTGGMVYIGVVVSYTTRGDNVPCVASGSHETLVGNELGLGLGYSSQIRSFHSLLSLPYSCSLRHSIPSRN